MSSLWLRMETAPVSPWSPAAAPFAVERHCAHLNSAVKGGGRSLRGATRFAILAAFALWLLLAGVAAVGQPSDRAVADGPPATAPVIIDGITLFRVRGVSSLPARARADTIAQRIKDAANNGIPVSSLVLVEAEGHMEIRMGGRKLMNVFDADAQVEQIDRKTLAEAQAARIAVEIERYRYARTFDYLLHSAGWAAGATIGLLLFLVSGAWLMRRIDAFLERHIRARLEGLETQSKRLVSATDLWGALLGLRRVLWTLAIIGAAVSWLEFVMHQFPWTRIIAVRVLDLLFQPLATIGRTIAAALPNLVFLAVLFVVSRYLLKTIRVFFSGVERGRLKISGFEREWAWPTYRLVRLAVIAFTAVVAYPYIPGSQSDAFKGISIFLGVMFSLGSTSVISNMIAGYSLIYRRAFRVGDRVRIDDHVGDVMLARLLVTHLRTPKNEEVVIPNSVILNSSVVNYSSMAREGELIVHTTVGIGYETPWRQVESMLLRAASRTGGVADDPAPFVLQHALGDFCVTYEINVYCNDAQDMPFVLARLHRNILDVFNEFGVQIMTPAYERDPEEPKMVPREQWYTPPAEPPPAATD